MCVYKLPFGWLMLLERLMKFAKQVQRQWRTFLIDGGVKLACVLNNYCLE